MVAVCLAPTDLRPEIDDLTGSVRADLRRSALTAAESAALEHALRVAEAWDGWVLAVAAAPPETGGVLQDVVALGVEVVRVGQPAHAGTAGSVSAPLLGGDLAGDPAGVAESLAGAIRARGRPAAVFCGDRSGRHGVGAVPALLAHALGLDQALGLVAVSVEGPGRLVVERRLDGGWRERLLVAGPAVLSVEGAGVRLRRAGLAAALEAEPGRIDAEPPSGTSGTDDGLRLGIPRPYRPRTRPVPPPAGDAHQRLLTLTAALTVREPARVVGPVDAGEAADELLAYLRRFGYAT